MYNRVGLCAEKRASGCWASPRRYKRAKWWWLLNIQVDHLEDLMSQLQGQVMTLWRPLANKKWINGARKSKIDFKPFLERTIVYLTSWSDHKQLSQQQTGQGKRMKQWLRFLEMMFNRIHRLLHHWVKWVNYCARIPQSTLAHPDLLERFMFLRWCFSHQRSQNQSARDSTWAKLTANLTPGSRCSLPVESHRTQLSQWWETTLWNVSNQGSHMSTASGVLLRVSHVGVPASVWLTPLTEAQGPGGQQVFAIYHISTNWTD